MDARESRVDNTDEIPAGWYPDGGDSDTLQFWDGQKLTEQRVPDPDTSVLSC